jgi:hypothetical protein
VRERLGDPRVVPSFRCPFLPDMPSSTTPRSSNIGKFQRTDVDIAFARATDGFVSRASGFISSTLHRSVDGTKVAMYAQWRGVEDYQTMCQEPALCHSSRRRSALQSLNQVSTRAC